MKYKLILCFVLLYWIGESGRVWADNWESVNVSGYNHDVVVSQSVTDDNDATFVDSNGSGAWFAFYSSLYASENSKEVDYAFPSNKTIVVSGGGRYTTKSHDENNVLQISSSFGLSQSGTLTLASPKAYSQIGVLCTGGNGATSFSVVINYTDGTSSPGTSVTASDWCAGGTYAARFKRIKIHATSSGAPIVPGTTDISAYMYEKTVSADETKTIQSITFSTTASGKIANIFAISGYTGSPVSTENVSYRDDAGTSQTVDAVPLTGSETSLSEGWYIVNSDITFNQTLTMSGNVNIIIADGCTMSVGTSGSAISGNGIETSGTLKIYKQSGKTGKLEIYSSGTSIATSGSGSFIEYDPQLVSGTCGTDAMWIVEDTDGDGINDKLTISGTGSIVDFGSADDQPWKGDASNIKTIEIGEGITSIGNYAFEGFSSLTSVSLPTTMYNIYSYAFKSCTQLPAIDLRNTTYIGWGTFDGCSSLEAIDLGKVSSVNGWAFRGCTRLRTIGTFIATYLCDLTFQDCSSLESITIPEGVTNLPQGFFYGCTNLSNVTLPSTLATISSYNVFQGCSSLRTITLPKNLQSSTSVYAWFSACENLMEIIVDDENLNYTSVDGVVYDKAKGTLVFHPVGKTTLSGEIPSSVTTIESSAFCNSKIQSATLPEGITIIKSNAFMGAALLEEIILPTTLTSIGDYAFHSCESLTGIIIPSSVESLGNNVFCWCTNLRSIYMANTSEITALEGREIAFNANYYVYVPENLLDSYKTATNWSSYSSRIKALAGITKGSSTGGSVDYTVSSSGKITLEGTTYVKEGATVTVTATPSSGFMLYKLVVKDANDADIAVSGTDNIRTFTMPSSSVTITPTFAELTDEAYAVLSTGNKTLTFYYDKRKAERLGTTYTITDGTTREWSSYRGQITTVEFDSSFSSYTGLTSTAYWFDNFYNLTTIVGIENLNTSNVTNMHRMFYYCQSLTNLDLTSLQTGNVTDMSYMFSYCTSLTSIDLSNLDTREVTDISIMFYYCKALTSVNLVNFNTSKVTNMRYMFHYCEKLLSIDLSSFDTRSLENMEDMFDRCYKLNEVTIGSNFCISPIVNTTFWLIGTEMSEGTLRIKGDRAPVIEQEMFRYTPSAGTLILEGGVTEDMLNLGNVLVDNMVYITWCGGQFNGKPGISINTPDAEWMSYYCTDDGHSYSLPDDVEAYYVTGMNGDEVSISPLEHFMTGVPMLLHKTGSFGDPKLYMYQEATTAEKPADTYHGYVGVAVSTSMDELLGDTQYILYNDEFLKLDREESIKLPANRCYLYVDNAASAPARLKIGGTTAIETIGSNIFSYGVYDLQGRKVCEPTDLERLKASHRIPAGVYILRSSEGHLQGKNGKKIILK